MVRLSETPWQVEEDELIRARYCTPGWTTGDIADRLGRTRNSVIGRAGRLGLRKPRPIITSQERLATVLAKREQRRKRMDAASRQRRATMAQQERVEGTKEQAAWRATVPKAGPSEQGVGLLDLQSHHCRSLLGYDVAGLPVYCGIPKADNGGSYCWMHYQIYHITTPRQRALERERLNLRIIKSGAWA